MSRSSTRRMHVRASMKWRPGATLSTPSIYGNVVGSVHAFRPARTANGAIRRLDLPTGGSTHIVSTNDCGPEAQFRFESFLTPTTLYMDDGDDKPVAIKSLPARFDASNLVTEQFFATSKDGTQIPYFVTRPRALKGPTPTVLYGYGGFEISMTPVYSAEFRHAVADARAASMWSPTSAAAASSARLAPGGAAGKPPEGL